MSNIDRWPYQKDPPLLVHPDDYKRYIYQPKAPLLISPAYNEELARRKQVKAVAIVSGGMDSVAMLYHLLDLEYQVHVLSFDYGQRHRKEIEFAVYHTQKQGLKHDIIDLTGITHLISNSALTSPHIPSGSVPFYELAPRAIEVPDGHYAEESMKATVVPNRNMIMLSIAAGVVVNEKASVLGIGVHAGDHFIYPDCRPDFIHRMEATILTGNEGFIAEDFKVEAPWLNLTKTDIVNAGNELGIDWTKTWSCYKGGAVHCGTCGTCVERKEAFRESTFGADPTIYQN